MHKDVVEPIGHRAKAIRARLRRGRRARGRRNAVLLAGAMALGAGVVPMLTAPPAHADVSAPSWWSGVCNAGNNLGSYALGASYNGVQACGPLPGTGTGRLVRFYAGAWGEYEWQCVELVMRYMYLAYGIAPYSANGNTVVGNYSGTTLAKVSNNGTSLPAPGDIISEAGTSSNQSGHTAVVTAVAVNGGTGTVTIMQQNASASGWGSIPVSGSVLGSGVTGWLHNPNVPPGPYHYQPFVGDFNGDGLADIGLRDASTGIFFIKHGTDFGDQITYPWAAGSNYQPFAGDFNGDGLADIGLRDSSTGIFFIKHGPGFGDQITYSWAAGTNYQPFVGDFNGDGLADIGLRDADIGMFFIKHGTGFNDQITYPWAAG